MKKRVILVVDDEPTILQMCRRMLVLNGFHVIEASTVREAFYKFSASVDLIICDLNMPGYYGVWLLKSARKKKPNIKFLLMNDNMSSEHISDAHSLGGTAFIQKPFQIEELIAAVNQCLTSQH